MVLLVVLAATDAHLLLPDHQLLTLAVVVVEPVLLAALLLVALAVVEPVVTVRLLAERLVLLTQAVAAVALTIGRTAAVTAAAAS